MSHNGLINNLNKKDLENYFKPSINKELENKAKYIINLYGSDTEATTFANQVLLFLNSLK